MSAHVDGHDETWRTDAYAPLEDEGPDVEEIPNVPRVRRDGDMVVLREVRGPDIVESFLPEPATASAMGLPPGRFATAARPVTQPYLDDDRETKRPARPPVPVFQSDPVSGSVRPVGAIYFPDPFAPTPRQTGIITHIQAPSDIQAPPLPEPVPEAEIILVPDAEQEAAMEEIQKHLFVDVSGTAGVGKTFLARTLAERMAGLVLTSTTGIAAVNLGEGQTINSLIGYYNTDSLREMFTMGFLQTILRRRRKAGLRRILLDEKSMLDGHQLTFLTRAIDEANQNKSLEDIGVSFENEEDERANSGKDLPPLGLILVGDFGQLPPVKAPFAFESAEWKRYAEHRVILKTIKRQTDRPFIEALHAIREGDTVKAMQYFTADKFSDHTDQMFDGTTIFAKNDAVDRYNTLRLDACAGDTVEFTSTRWGKTDPDWKNIPERLAIKTQARVMILANRRTMGLDEDGPGQMIYCNGDAGTLEDVQGEGARALAFVRLDRTGCVVPVKFVTREVLLPLEPGRRKELRESGQMDKIKDKYEIAGALTYMPLRLAWGTTCHKSQGLSLDRVQVNFRDSFFGQAQMMFVALSRARTPGGLRLVGSQSGFVQRINTNPAIRPWL